MMAELFIPAHRNNGVPPSPVGDHYDPHCLLIPAADKHHSPNRREFRVSYPLSIGDDLAGFIRQPDHPYNDVNSLLRAGLYHGAHHVATVISSGHLRDISLRIQAETEARNINAVIEMNAATVEGYAEAERRRHSAEETAALVRQLEVHVTTHPDSWVRSQLSAILERIR
jgi:hypothetical protein